MSKQIISVLRLRERRTLDWLAEALGFELQEVTPGETEHDLRHAQLVYGDQLMMASTEGKLAMEPGRASTYLTVDGDDAVDEAYARAMSAGATSELEPEGVDYGGRNATVRDPEGNYWSFGSYQPSVG